MATVAQQPTDSMVSPASTVSERHLDALLNDLRQEVTELRNKQGDMAQVKDQITYLNSKYQ